MNNICPRTTQSISRFGFMSSMGALLSVCCRYQSYLSLSFILIDTFDYTFYLIVFTVNWIFPICWSFAMMVATLTIVVVPSMFLYFANIIPYGRVSRRFPTNQRTLVDQLRNLFILSDSTTVFYRTCLFRAIQ